MLLFSYRLSVLRLLLACLYSLPLSIIAPPFKFECIFLLSILVVFHHIKRLNVHMYRGWPGRWDMAWSDLEKYNFETYCGSVFLEPFFWKCAFSLQFWVVLNCAHASVRTCGALAVAAFCAPRSTVTYIIVGRFMFYSEQRVDSDVAVEKKTERQTKEGIIHQKKIPRSSKARWEVTSESVFPGLVNSRNQSAMHQYWND